MCCKFIISRRAQKGKACKQKLPRSNPLFYSAYGLPGNAGDLCRRQVKPCLLPGNDGTKAAVHCKNQRIFLLLGAAARRELAQAALGNQLFGVAGKLRLPAFAVKRCAEAREYGFAMVAINPAPVSLCKDLLAGTSVHVGAAIGFPLGQSTPQVKKYEAVDAIANGADEIDYVINITQLKEKNYDFIEHEMAGIVEECRSAGAISKVIFENCYLTEEEKRALCSIAREVRPDFIKTSTGFGTGGATFEDVALMKKCVGDEVKIKAAGGIRTLDTALRMIELGVSRIGSTASVSIVEELKHRL